MKIKIDEINELLNIYNYDITITKFNYKLCAKCFNGNLLIDGEKLLLDELSKVLFLNNFHFKTIKINKDYMVDFINSFRKFSDGIFKLISDDIIQKYSFEERKIKRSLFAGGCFWCIANNFYDLPGVIEVYSGYSGGNKCFPTYIDVKSGKTGHKESILIVYDSSRVSYENLLKLFLESIDPFDDGGQFIDRGSSYQTAIFEDDENHIKLFIEMKKLIENKYKNEVAVKIEKNNIFYLAEEEHQKFSVKNYEKFMEEEKKSGRLDYKNIEI